jgi:hypothetical protein
MYFCSPLGPRKGNKRAAAPQKGNLTRYMRQNVRVQGHFPGMGKIKFCRFADW